MSKTISIMQPYLFPYLGYFQMISAVDTFVLYDDVQFVNRGWVNRNKILINGADGWLVLPLKKAAYSAKIVERFTVDDFQEATDKLLRGIRMSYARAPCFPDIFPLLESIIKFPERNFARYLENSIRRLCAYMGIKTEILMSSRLSIGTDLNGRHRVIRIVKELGGDSTINPIGGIDMYSCEDFRREGITLKFIKMHEMRYRQFGSGFIPSLSIIDVLMFNELEAIRKKLRCYSLVENQTENQAPGRATPWQVHAALRPSPVRL